MAWCCRPPMGFKDWESFFFVSVVIFLISFIPITSNYYIFWPWLTYYSKAAYFRYAGIFDFSVALIWFYYFLTMKTGAGTTPKGYDPWRGKVTHAKDEQGTDEETSLIESSAGNGRGGENGTTRRKKGSKKGAAHDSGANNGQEDEEEEVLAMVLELKKSTSEPRWCKTCQCYKPPRSHHCSDCNVCVLKMDHHCPWVNTCVGHNNLGHFYRFLVAVSFGVIYCVSLIGLRIWGLMQLSRALDRYYRTPWPHTEGQADLAKYVTPQPTTVELVMMILNIILCFVLLFTVFILMLFQTYYISTNVTTIETMEKDRMDLLVEKGKISAERAKYPYDLGLLRNFKQVLGSTWWAWIWPQKPEGDGISFPVNETARKHGQAVEHDGKKYIVVMYPPPEYYEFYGKKRGAGGAPVPPPRFDQQPGGQPRQQEQAVTTQHVRRGSEGYVVRSLTEEDRERMVAMSMAEDENKALAAALQHGSAATPASLPAPTQQQQQQPVAAIDAKLSKARRKKLKAKSKKSRLVDGTESNSSSYLADAEVAGANSGATSMDSQSEDDVINNAAEEEEDEDEEGEETEGGNEADEEAELWRIAKPQAASNRRR